MTSCRLTVSPREAAERIVDTMRHINTPNIERTPQFAVTRPTPEGNETAYRKRGHGIPIAVRRAVYARDGYRCALCDDTRRLQIHHVVKRSLGGSDFPENLITLCWRCHAVAHGQRFDEYPAHIDADWMEQACVEYLSDYYAEQGEPWYPFK